MKTAEQKFEKLFEQMYDLCGENGWGDPFNYSRSREIHMAGKLGHQIADDYSGADGYDEDGGCEYKSTIADSINATYNGISVQDTWEDQVDYLKDHKIGCYSNHYHARYRDGKIVECYKLKADDIMNIALNKLHHQFYKKKINPGKDPRLGFTVNRSEIRRYGERII